MKSRLTVFAMAIALVLAVLLSFVIPYLLYADEASCSSGGCSCSCSGTGCYCGAENGSCLCKCNSGSSSKCIAK